MIKPPAGWTQHHGIHLITLYPPQGGGRIRCYERIRPVTRFSQVLHTVLATDPLFRISSVADATTLVTDEGEYGAWARVDGTREGQRCTRFIGAVFADEFACAVDAFVLVRAQRALLQQFARELVLSTELKLGVRRRRFLYQPPPGWRAIPNGLAATWYPPDFPNNRVNLVVPAAEPARDATVDEVIDVTSALAAERERGFELVGEPDVAEVISVGGITGRRSAITVKHTTQGETKRAEVAAFHVPPYVYSMRMESLLPAKADEHHQIFMDAVRTVAAVPVPGAGRVSASASAAPGDAMSHWGD